MPEQNEKSSIPPPPDDDIELDIATIVLDTTSRVDAPQSNATPAGESLTDQPEWQITPPHRSQASLASARRLQRAYRRLSICHADVSFLRAQVDVAWQTHHRFRGYYVDSHALYLAALSRARSRDQDGAKVIRVRRERVDRDRTRLESQHAMASDLEQKLVVLENEMYSLNERYVQAAAELVELTDLARQDNPQPTLHSRSASSASSSSIHTLSPRLDKRLARYYDRAGDVKIQVERKADLECDYREELEYRIVRQDRGERLSLSDEDFELLYDREREIYECEVEVARQSANSLRAECEDAGININEGKRADSESDGDNGSSSSTLDIANAISAPRVPSPFSSIFSQLIDGSTKIGTDGVSVFEVDMLSNADFVVPEEDQSLSHVARWVQDTQERVPATLDVSSEYYSGHATTTESFAFPPLSTLQPTGIEPQEHDKPRSEPDIRHRDC